MKYRITTCFETLYTHETETKIKITNDYYAAIDAYIVYIKNPETRFCSIDIVGAHNEPQKIIAAFNGR